MWFSGKSGVSKVAFRRMMRIWAAAAFCVALAGCGRKVSQESSGRGLKDRDDFVLDPGVMNMGFVAVENLNLLVGRYEASNGQYRRFRPDHSSGEYRGLSLDNNDQPVVNVSWEDARAFCEWLSGEFEIVEGRKYVFRLPTAQEWETYAACGDDREYPWGQFWPPPHTWNYYGSENPGPGAKLDSDDKNKVSCPIGKSGANEWRLFGVGGNVWEWCEDHGDAGGETRLLKGASWVDCHPLFLAIGRSRMYAPSYRAVNMGFRVVAEAKDATPEEIEAFAARKSEEDAKRKADETRKLDQMARNEEEQRQRDAEEKRNSQASARGEIRTLLSDKDFKLVAYRLEKYESDFGKDEFYDEVSRQVANTRLVRLAERVFIEFIRKPGLDCWVGKYEVTNGQFRQFKSEHQVEAFRDHVLNGDEQPAVNVSWKAAKEFCDWLNSSFPNSLEKGLQFRLPTVREWETFASCGETRDFPWGSEWPPPYGNFGSIDDYDDGFLVSCPVGESGVNDWGLYGVAGNVWEWCEDSEPGGVRRILKGGAWNLFRADALKLASNISDDPDQKNIYIGFRVVMGPSLDRGE